MGIVKVDTMDNAMVLDHQDLLGELNQSSSITDKINYLHRITRKRHSYIDRIAVAIYDPACDLLKTYAHSTDTGNPLPLYQAKLSETTSLKQIQFERKPRVINDLSMLSGSQHQHTKNIRKHGYFSSYTVPLFLDSQLTGFVFFNSRRRNIFDDEGLSYLDMIARLVALLVHTDLQGINTLRAALKTATQFTHQRDPETGAHLERMAHFTRLIARQVAAEEGHNDEYVENMFWFSPLHDVGKIAIPDNILLKPGRLSCDEFEVMKTHTTKGGELISNMLSNFSMHHEQHTQMLHNIVTYHHENLDGSGYPEGLQGDNIPLEARIIAVADVFDALTSERPYKSAWDNERAFKELWNLAGSKLDPKLVEALESESDTVVEIQQQFRDEN
jgi:HD-GYP domain-containing protein (c-di-GMP phosphodiesterase class II)